MPNSSSLKHDHIEEVLRAAASSQAAAISPIAASWSRSLHKHGLTPDEAPRHVRLDSLETQQRREAMSRLFRVSQKVMDQLHGLIGGSGYAVFLCDAAGAILDQRTRPEDDTQFEQAGLCTGADWSECHQGTNGIGTCIAENRPVVIHRTQHFHSCNIAMSCMGAPIYNETGQLSAVLDVSACRDDLDAAFTNLIAQTVSHAAQQIEADHFDSVFSNERIIRRSSSSDKGPVLLAVDKNDLIIGATRTARKQYDLDVDLRKRPLPAADILGDAEERGVGLGSAEKRELTRAIARANGNMSATARALGVSRATLYRRMAKHGLDVSQ